MGPVEKKAGIAAESPYRDKTFPPPSIDRLSGIRAATKKMVREFFGRPEEISICERNMDKLAGLFEKRGYNFFNSFLSHARKISAIHATLLFGLLSDRTIAEISQFSINGLDRWAKVIEGPTTRMSSVSDLYDQVTMAGEAYSDVEAYKAGSAAVTLEEVKESLKMFALAAFGRFVIFSESESGAAALPFSDYIFLPKVMSDFETREENERAYYLLSGHEGAHKAYGSFTVKFDEVKGQLEREGVTIRKIEENNTTGGKEEDGFIAEYSGRSVRMGIGANNFNDVLQLLPDAMLLHTLWNAFDDMRIVSRMLDEKMPGYAAAYRGFALALLEKRMKNFDDKKGVEKTCEGILAVTTLLSVAADKKAAADALFPGFLKRFRKSGYHPSKEEEALLGICRKLPKKDLKLMKKFKARLVKLALSKEDHSSDSWNLSFEIKKKMKIKKPPKVKKTKKGAPVDMAWDVWRRNGLPSVDPAGLSPSIPIEKIRVDFGNDSKAVPEQVHTKDVEKEMEEQVNVNRQRLDESDVQLDQGLVNRVKRLLLEITSQRLSERPGALCGKVDHKERMRWLSEKRRGIIKMRDYHLEQFVEEGRSVAMLSIGDASGSTGCMVGQERKIDTIVRANNSLAQAINQVSGFRFAYGFFNRDSTTNYYEGMAFNDRVRHTKVEAGGYNIDHEIINFAGMLLKSQRAAVKILVLNLDSMTAYGYGRVTGIEMVRRALNRLRKSGIIPFVITLPPDQFYYQDAGFEDMGQYLDHIYGKGGYKLIESIDQIEDAWLFFLRSRSRLFKGKRLA